MLLNAILDGLAVATALSVLVLAATTSFAFRWLGARAIERWRPGTTARLLANLRANPFRWARARLGVVLLLLFAGTVPLWLMILATMRIEPDPAIGLLLYRVVGPFAGLVAAALLLALVAVLTIIGAFIAEAWTRKERARLSASLCAVVLFLGLPWALGVLEPWGVEFAQVTVTDIDDYLRSANLEDQRFRASDDPASACSGLMMSAGLYEADAKVPPEGTPVIALARFYAVVYVENFLKGALLDIPESFGCKLTPIEHDPSNLYFAGLLAVWRFLCAAALTVLLLPLALRLRVRMTA